MLETKKTNKSLIEEYRQKDQRIKNLKNLETSCLERQRNQEEKQSMISKAQYEAQQEKLRLSLHKQQLKKQNMDRINQINYEKTLSKIERQRSLNKKLQEKQDLALHQKSTLKLKQRESELLREQEQYFKR